MGSKTSNTFNFEYCFKIIVGHEGKFGKNPKDTGNWTGGKVGSGVLKGTKYGISARSYPHLDIENLTLEQAKQIYFNDYWLKLRLHEPALNLIAFDAAINHGLSAANRILDKVKPISTVVAQVEEFRKERMIIYNRQPEEQKKEFLKGWTNRLADIVSRTLNNLNA